VRSRGVAQTTFVVEPSRSAVLVKARSNVGPISFATSDIHGKIEVGVDGETVVDGAPTAAHLTISLKSLTSGNSLYDTELRRRIDARRFPDASLELERAAKTGDTGQFALSGRISIHDVVRPIEGSVTIEPVRRGILVVRGVETLDIREFALEVPTTLALKIYPEVSVEMHLEALAS